MAIQSMNLTEMLEAYFSDQLIKNIIKRLKNGIQHKYHATVCMSGCKPNLKDYSYDFLFNCATQNQRWPLLKALIRWLVPDACLWLGPPWLILRFSLPLTISES